MRPNKIPAKVENISVIPFIRPNTCNGNVRFIKTQFPLKTEAVNHYISAKKSEKYGSKRSNLDFLTKRTERS